MAAVLERTTAAPSSGPGAGATPSWWSEPRWNRYTPRQLVVLALAAVGPLVILSAIVGALLGIISTNTMIDVALEAGEDPGMIVFGAMYLASPVQWFTGRSQIRVRKYLGIVFFGLALSNGAMFLIESGAGDVFREPLVAAGSVAFLLSVPLFLTSSRWSQRALGMKRWRLLHKLTHLVAVVLLAHVALAGDGGPGVVLIALGLLARVPLVSQWIARAGSRRRNPGLS